MEEESGVEFEKDYKAVFYMDLPPIGARGFEKGNLLISTLQPYKSKDNVLNTPFHEYSHRLFQTFTRKTEFTQVTDKLLKEKDLLESFENGGDKGYDWIGWCEENLVEGFSRYLEYKYYGEMNSKKTYIYDLMFYEYLIENEFNPEEKTLEDISIEFYEKVLDDKL
ncbi:hypothetical protein [Romboutsia sp.]|uniref:hypothetical protein n=1 Tax=Romboutsia sp. TaxID=1965302 RepID=UPI003F2F8982